MTQAPSGGESARQLLLGSAALFILSCLFPIAASVLEVVHPPRWMGVADVAVAAMVVLVAMLIMSRKPSGFTPPIVASSFKAYRVLANAFLLLLALFFLVGDSIRWSTLVPGLAWRGWLLTMVLPSCSRSGTPSDGV
jgi:hypothetical protein